MLYLGDDIHPSQCPLQERVSSVMAAIPMKANVANRNTATVPSMSIWSFKSTFLLVLYFVTVFVFPLIGGWQTSNLDVCGDTRDSYKAPYFTTGMVEAPKAVDHALPNLIASFIRHPSMHVKVHIYTKGTKCCL